MSFVKLDSGILDSSLWPDRLARELFITALAMADPHEVLEPTPGILVRSLEESGVIIQPGWYGIVKAAGSGIVRRACIDDPEAGLDALERLGAPDLESRSADYEGRRLIRIDGGWIVVNYDKYRQRDTTSAERQKRYRERQNSNAALRVTLRNDRNETRNITQEEGEVEGEVEVELKEEEGGKTPQPPPGPAPSEFLTTWNAAALAANLKPAGRMTNKRATALSQRRADPLWRERWQEAITAAFATPFCRGINPRGWTATVDWFLRPDTLDKILEGFYDDKAPPKKEMIELYKFDDDGNPIN
jgi:hypothetical protein